MLCYALFIYCIFTQSLATLKGIFTCSYLESDLEKPDTLLKIKERGSTELWLASVSTVINPPSHDLLHANIMPLADATIVKVPVF